MDTKEITILVKALSRAVAMREPAAGIITILEKLKDGVVATEDVLRSTKAGVAVNKVKQHADKDVAHLAADIVAGWREDINKIKTASSKGHKGSPKKIANADISASKAVRSKSKSKTPEPKPQIKPTAYQDRRTWVKDNMDVARTGDEVRDKGLGLMYDGLCFESSELSDVIMARALEVEEAVFQHFGGRVTSGYREKLRSLYMNLKNKSNPQLRVQVVAGEILASRIVTMTSDELKSAKRREEDVKLQQENMNKAMVAQVEKSVSTALTCGKCGQKKVSYSQAQTRSADEPMTTFCECQVCGNRWKFS